MVKLAGTVMIAAASLAAGAYLSDNARKRLIQLRASESLTAQLILSFRFSGLDVFEACGRLAAEGSLSSLDFLSVLAKAEYSDSIPFGERWKSAVSDWNDCRLDNEEKELLLSVGDFLGKTDLDGQIMSLEGLRERFRERIAQLVPETEKRVKLCTSLSVLCGAAVLLMLS